MFGSFSYDYLIFLQHFLKRFDPLNYLCMFVESICVFMVFFCTSICFISLCMSVLKPVLHCSDCLPLREVLMKSGNIAFSFCFLLKIVFSRPDPLHLHINLGRLSSLGTGSTSSLYCYPAEPPKRGPFPYLLTD